MKGLFLFSFLTVLGGQFPSCNSCTRFLEGPPDYTVYSNYNTISVNEKITELKTKGFVINPKIEVEVFLENIDTNSLFGRFYGDYNNNIYILYGRELDGVDVSKNVFNIDPARRLDCNSLFEKLNEASDGLIELKKYVKLERNRLSLNYLVNGKEFYDTLWLEARKFNSPRQILLNSIQDNLYFDSLGVYLKHWKGEVYFNEGPFSYKKALTIGVFKEDYYL